MSSNKIFIEFNEKAGTFIASCPFALNHIIRQVPSKRFRKADRRWLFKPLRANCNALLEHMDRYIVLVDDITAIKFQEALATEIKSNMTPFPANFPFKLPPREKQMEALNHLYGHYGHAILSKPGTGKTKIETDLVSCYWIEGIVTHWLILCPFSIKENWKEELEKHCAIGYSAHIFHTEKKSDIRKANEFIESDHPFKIAIAGTESLNRQDKKGKPEGVLVEMLTRFMVNGPGKAAITIDESHLVKNHKANRTQNIKMLSLASPVRGILTGTVIANSPMDFYAQYDIADENALGVGDYYSFRNRYAEMGGFEGRQIQGYKNMEELTTLVAPITFQCELSDMKDIPEPIRPPVRRFKLTPLQKKYYNMVAKEGKLQVGGLLEGSAASDIEEIVLENVLQVYLALQQIVNGYFSHKILTEDLDGRERMETKIEWLVEPHKNPKYKAALELIDEQPGERYILWSKFVPTIEQFCELRSETGVPYYGKCTEEERNENKRAFIEGTKTEFISNPSVGGVGLNGLDVCEYTIFLDNSFKLIDRIQAEGRTRRLSSLKTAVYYDLAPEGNTIDDVILAAVAEKKDISEYIRDNLKLAISAIQQI